MISFDQIMMARAKEVAKKGMKPEGSPEGAPQEGPPQEGAPQGPPREALMRRIKPPPQIGADPRMYLQKLPPEVAELAYRYRRI